MKHTPSHIQHQKGFTLIELLVVIAIISLLSSVILTSTNIARAKGRDANRTSDMVQLRNALALYDLDHNGYPPCPTTTCTGANFTSTLNALVTGGYISKVLQDPLNQGQYVYYYQTDVTSGNAKAGIVMYVSESKSSASVPNYTEGILIGSNTFSPSISVNNIIGGGTVSNP
jgi:prepilin-type N-terminal cleavage/methylation domain-containing protein